MSGFEVFAVVSAVAAVISAYRDGGRIVAEIKEKRARKKAAPPTKFLEESLSRGPPALEEAKNNGVERFGQAFAVGDKIATESLKDILISLQSSLLKHLYPAAGNDDVIDFSLLVDISDIGRIKAVSALYELHMRMAVAAPIVQIPTQILGDDSQIETIQSHALQPRTDSNSNCAGPDLLDAESLPGQALLKHHRPKSTIETPTSTGQTSSTSPSPNSFSKIPWIGRRRSSQAPQPSTPSSPSSGTQTSTHRPWKNVLSPSLNVASSNVIVTTNLRQGEESTFKVEKADTRSSFSSQATSAAITFPSPANDYCGFCKGAYYLQVGLSYDGVQVKNASTAKTGEGYYWGCRNKYCVFEGPVCKIRKDFFFDDSVREFGCLRYRWSFLAKSHVAIKKSKNQIYNYRCIFCILQGVPALAITKIRPFLEHVELHQGQQLEEWILRKTLCINDRIATDDEYFDINLQPPDKNHENASKEDNANLAVQDPGLYGSNILEDNPWRQS